MTETTNTCRVCSATTDAFVCRSCYRQVERAVAELPGLLDELRVVQSRQSNVYRSAVTREPEAEQRDAENHLPAMLRSRDGAIALRSFPMPVDLNASELLWIAGNTVSTWCRHLAESRGVELETPAPLSWLLTNLEAIRWDEAGAELHDELTYLHGQVERAVDRSPSRLYAGPCHAMVEHVETYERDGTIYTTTDTRRCEQDLYAWPNASGIVCDGHRSDGHGCGTQHTWGERRQWLTTALSDALVTVDDLLAALPVLFPDLPVPPMASIKGWIRTGRIQAHGHDRLGEPTFVGGDMLKLISEYRPHKFAPRRRRAA